MCLSQSLKYKGDCFIRKVQSRSFAMTMIENIFLLPRMAHLISFSWYAILKHVDARYASSKAIIPKNCSYPPKKCHFLRGLKLDLMQSPWYNAGFSEVSFRTPSSIKWLKYCILIFGVFTLIFRKIYSI